MICILVAFLLIYFFGISYQRCGRRSASNRTNPFIPYVGHMKTHIIQRHCIKKLAKEILIFLTKILIFLLSNTNNQFCLCSYWACSYPAKKFLFCQKVLIAHRSSFCAEKFLFRTSFDESEKAPFSRSHATYWQIFLSKDEILL